MRILVGMDDLTSSEEALRALVAQVRPRNTEVRLLHVLQPIAVSAPPQMSGHYAPELEGQGKQARELLERPAKTLRSAGFKVHTSVEQGDVRLKLIDIAAEWGADLIVIGSRGRSAISRLLLGSVAEFVARHASCSVEIVRIPITKGRSIPNRSVYQRAKRRQNKRKGAQLTNYLLEPHPELHL